MEGDSAAPSVSLGLRGHCICCLHSIHCLYSCEVLRSKGMDSARQAVGWNQPTLCSVAREAGIAPS